MATGISVALQTKIFEILAGDATLRDAYGVQVFDNVPDNKTYPYVQIGDDELDDWSAHDFDGFQVTIEIHTWTQEQSKKLCKQIQDRIYELLHEEDLELDGQETVSFRAGLQTTMTDPEDNKTQHGVNRFNLLLGG